MEAYSNGKLNLRLQVLQGLLDSMGDASSAKMNSLRQTIRRNKADTAHTATKALDLLRQIVQDDITKELKEVVERHVELTFAPAIENIKRNKVDFNEEHVHTLCRSILEAAKGAFVSPIAVTREEFTSPEPPQGASYLANKRLHPDLRRFYYREKEVDSDAESDISHASMGSRGRKRVHRVVDFGASSPARSSTPTGIYNAPGGVTLAEVQKWDPNRVSTSSKFILGSKANKCLGMTQRGRIYIKYPRIFRYVGDNQDKLWLYENGLTTRSGGRAFFMVLDDVIELARLEECTNAESSPANLERHSFIVPQWLVKKIKDNMTITHDQLKSKLSSNSFDQPVISLPSADSPISE